MASRSRALFLNEMLELQVKEFVRNHRGLKELPSLEADLAEDTGLWGEEAYVLLEEFARRFEVDMSGFPFDEYFGSDALIDISWKTICSWLLWLIGLRKRQDVYWPWPKKPLTVGDLVEAAERGRW